MLAFTAMDTLISLLPKSMALITVRCKRLYLGYAICLLSVEHVLCKLRTDPSDLQYLKDGVIHRASDTWNYWQSTLANTHGSGIISVPGLGNAVGASTLSGKIKRYTIPYAEAPVRSRRFSVRQDRLMVVLAKYFPCRVM